MDLERKDSLSPSDSECVSVVIRCRNAEEDLRVCLRTLGSQRFPDGVLLEVIVVDNESTDGSVCVAQEHGAMVLHLASREFSWGRALNVGIAAARGDIVILLSADAHPANEQWLTEMLAPFKDEKVVVVYGRQIPRRDAPIGERARLARTFVDVSTAYRKEIPGTLHSAAVQVASNSCAAIRRSVWKWLPYDELVAACEDRVWTDQVISSGYTVYYQASACVYHSHRDSIGRYAWRHWEFYEKRQRDLGRSISVTTVLRTCAAIPKSRIGQCLSVRHHTFSKIIGLTRVPFESLFFLIIASTCWHTGFKSRIRSIMWR